MHSQSFSPVVVSRMKMYIIEVFNFSSQFIICFDCHIFTFFSKAKKQADFIRLIHLSKDTFHENIAHRIPLISIFLKNKCHSWMQNEINLKGLSMFLDQIYGCCKTDQLHHFGIIPFTVEIYKRHFVILRQLLSFLH